MARVSALLSLLLTCACEDDAVPATQPDPVIRAPAAPVSALLHEPGSYRGQTVRVAGEVEQVHDPRAFTLEGEAWREDDITVLAKTRITFVGTPIQDGDEVTAIGRIAIGSAEVERALGRSLHADLARAIGDRPVLIATSVRRND